LNKLLYQGCINDGYFKEIHDSCKELIQMCNDSFHSIHHDYGNNTISKKLMFIPIERETAKEIELNDEELKKSDKDIILHEYQIEHTIRLMEILETSHFAIDLSPLGTGKTFSSSFIYQSNPDYNYIISIAPTSVNLKWKSVKEEYGFEKMTNLTYKELIGSKGKNPNCDLLIRRDYTIMRSNHVVIGKVDYTTSPLFQLMANKGLLLVIDEFQNIKNDSLQTIACKSMIKYIHENTVNSKILLLSGSPMDKHTQVVEFFKTVNVMTSDNLSKFDIGNFQRTGDKSSNWQGMREIVDYCIKDPIKHVQYMANHQNENSNKLTKLCYKLFLEYVKPNYSSSMQNVPSLFKINKMNGYYNMDKKQLDLLIHGLRILNSYIEKQNPNHVRNRNDVAEMLRILTKGLMMIETSKIPLFTRLVYKQFSENPSQKIVISCNYSDTIVDLEKELAEFNPLILNGSKSAKERFNTLEKFQRNTLEFRLLIGNIRCINSGIDLDDKFGDIPRTCFVSPSYGTIDLYQLSHRFLRSLDTKSDTNLYVVYCKKSKQVDEERLLKAINKKGEIMKNITIEQSHQGIIFPCDFQKYEEPAL
jgi:superfamily II DNA or RNA helicase